MKSILTFSAASVLAFAVTSSFVSAETATPKKITPRTGLLSTTMAGGERSTVISTGEQTVEGGNFHQAPIAGSVSRISPREWKMVVGNNTKDPYSVDVAVRQINGRGAVIKTDHYSYTLRAGEEVSRSIPGVPTSVDAQLDLSRFKNLAPKKSETKAEGAPQAAEGASGAPVK